LDLQSLVFRALGRCIGDMLRKRKGNGDASAETAADRISQIAGEGLTALKSQTAQHAPAAKADAEDVVAKAHAEAERVREAAEKAGAVVESKAAAVAAKAAPTDTNVKQWAKWMADQLRGVPDIKSYGALRLRDLAPKG